MLGDQFSFEDLACAHIARSTCDRTTGVAAGSAVADSFEISELVEVAFGVW